MLSRVASRAARPLAAAPLLSRGALAPAHLVSGRALRDRQASREASSKAALAKMGELSVDRLAGNSTVQGVEYVLTGLDRLVNWARKTSMWPMTFGLA